jgi:methylmalonyl-CoA mutase N-terminal domain/subunit
LWSTILRDRYGAKDERSLKLRFHAQTAGCSLTWQQPYNNVVRTSIQALAAVLGGAQSLHTNSLDEAYALPSEHAVTIALRTQQVIAHESGVVDTPDPLGGSYFLERLTLDLEAGARDYIRQIDEMGGMIPAIEAGFPQREIARASYAYQQAVEKGEKVIVGVNRFAADREEPIELLKIDANAQDHQSRKLRDLRARRSSERVRSSLDALRRAADGAENTMPYIIDAVKAYCTLGEICDALRDVFGSYTEASFV